jgi:cob(I)alamin adenosyltransferase
MVLSFSTGASEIHVKESGGKIYTGVGDRGQTRLLGGEIVEKDDVRVMAYGALDELQSHLGFARTIVRPEQIQRILFQIQKDLFTVGSELASTSENIFRLKRRIGEEEAEGIERQIDDLTARYGLPKSFVVPGRSSESAVLHVARSICRRCERWVVKLNRQAKQYASLIVYLNRLSDLLFVLAWSLEVVAIVEEVLKGLSSSSCGGEHS